jgi:hypothetical protein
MSTRNLVVMGAPWWARKAIGAALVVAAAGGCVRIDGGAVELSWVLRTPDGRAISDCACSAAQVATVRLNLILMNADGAVPGGTPCAGRAQCQFACQRHTGATPFDIPETKPDETYRVSVDALDKDGAVLAAVGTPAPVLRTVSKGQPTDMGALLLVAECHADCSGMNGQGVCARP